MIRSTIKKIKSYKNLPKRTVYLLTTAVFIITIFSSTLVYLMVTKRTYKLSDSSTSLLSVSDKSLFNSYIYNEKERSYTLNPSILPDENQPKPVQEMVASIGAKEGSQDGSKNIAIEIPENFSDGKKIYDKNMKLSIVIAPLFNAGNSGIDERGYFVYPLTDVDGTVVYTPQKGGIKEDIILDKYISDSVTYSYRLELGDYMEARIVEGGGVGIFSGDPSLFTDTKFNDDTAWQEIDKIRKEANKTNLVFTIPAPKIVQSGDNPEGSGAFSYYKLTNNVLSVVTERLNNAKYPISIDPTVTVTSDSDFLQGNNDGGITYGSGQISRAGLTGAEPTFSTTGMNNLTENKRQAGNAIAYNDYMYLIGGSTDGTTYNTTVERGTVGGTGLVTGWTTSGQTQLSTGRRDHATVQYNGYIYVIGGRESSGTVATVLVSQISGGNIGSWTSTTSLPAARRALSAVVYNGYIYAVGGDSGTAGTAAQTSFYSAPIKGDGTLGSWTTLSGSNPLPSARFDGAAVAFNNALYYIGGDSNSGTATSTTYYIFLDSNGGVTGSWVQESTNSNDTIDILVTRRQHSAVVNAGYIYVLGGTGTTTSIEYAAANTDGSISNWYNFRYQATDKTLAGGRSQSSATSYKGKLYVFGGNVAGQLNTSEKADISAVGPISKVKSSTDLPCTKHQAGTAVYNGYIYSTGGIGAVDCDPVTGGNQNSREVALYSKIDEKGVPGSWTVSTNLLPEPLTTNCSVALNGYLYTAGGWDNTTSIFNKDVYVTSLSSANGSIGAWTSTAALPRAARGGECLTFNNRLYVIGGSYCSDIDENCGNGIGTDISFASSFIFIAEPNSDGTISTWLDNDDVGPSNEGEDMPTVNPALNGQARSTFVHNGRIYRLENTLKDIAYNDIDPTYGYIDGSWTYDSTDELATSRQNAAAGVWNGYVYFVNGATGSGGGDTVTASIEYMKINEDGSLVQTGNAGNDYTSERRDASNVAISARNNGVVISRGTIVMMGGCDGASTCSAINDVQYAQINNGGSGLLPSTNATTSLATAVVNHCSVALNGYLYNIGGEESSTPVGTVRLAPLSSNGSVGAWSTTNALPGSAVRTKHDCTVASDTIYVVGGSNGSSSQSTVYYGVQGANGAINWNTTSSLNNVRQDLSVVAFNNRLYAIAGYSTSTTDERNDVEYVTINSDKSLGSWTTDGDVLTTKRQRAGAVAYGGYLFVLGGSNGGASPTTLLDEVVVSAIDTGSGSIGTWSVRNKLVQPTDDFSTFAVNGYIYVVGGRISTAGSGNNEVRYLNRIAVTSITASSSSAYLSQWDPNDSLSVYVHQQSIAYWNGFLYITGGRGGVSATTPSDLTSVSYSGVRSISRIGTFSTLLKLAGSYDLSMQSLIYQGTVLPNSVVTFRFRKTCISGGGVLGPVLNIGSLRPNESEPLSVIGHYILLIVSIDDSQAGLFHDSSNNPSNISQIDLEYTYGYSDVDDRLSGGKFFKNQIEQPLDTTTSLGGGALGCS